MTAPEEQAPISDTAASSAEPEQPRAPYRTGTWAGRPHYRCASCSYDTLDQSEIDRHVRLAHGLKTTSGKE